MIDKKLKIVWLSPYPLDILVPFGLKLTRPAGGHPCSWIVNWAESLASLSDIDLHIVTYSSKIKQSQTVIYDGYTVHIVRDAIPFTDKSFEGLFDFDAMTGFASRKRKLFKKIKELNPDIVHGHGTENVYGLLAVESGFPSVVSIQGVISDYLRTNPSHRFKYTVKTEAKTVKQGHYFMCRTHFDKSFVKTLNNNAKIFHMPEAMNSCFFSINRSDLDEISILHVGGFDPRKGMIELLSAVKKIKEFFPQVMVDSAGGGTRIHKNKIIKYAEELGILDCIRFHGFLTAMELANLHSSATVFAMTSQNENSPNSLAEALCAGTPSVAYDVGGVSSMFVNGESGFLVPAGDFDFLAQKVCELLSSPELQMRFGDKSCKDSFVNRPDQVAEQSLIYYKEILGVM